MYGLLKVTELSCIGGEGGRYARKKAVIPSQ